MSFKLSQRSLDKMDGVDERLIAVAKLAIQNTSIDFGVICGLRTIEEQRELFDKGASKTMASKHISGDALDLMAYIGSRGSGLRWGAAWHCPDVREWNGSCEDLMNAYVDLRRSQGKRPFIDAPHWEISE